MHQRIISLTAFYLQPSTNQRVQNKSKKPKRILRTFKLLELLLIQKVTITAEKKITIEALFCASCVLFYIIQTEFPFMLYFMPDTILNTQT